MSKTYFDLHKQHFNLNAFVTNALKEDRGDGDHSTLATVPENQNGKMQLLVKEAGVLAGVQAAEAIIARIDPRIKMKALLKDGSKVKPKQVAFVLEGNTQNLLLAERLVLNVMQRMSGIATKTAHLQNLCKGTKTKVIDTRKTTPGFRFFEKWAVVIGGGANHRFGLYDMILIKDNHIDFCGSIEGAIDSANHYLKSKKLKLPIEIETRNISDVKRVLKHGGVKRVLLDNFTPAQTFGAVKLIHNKFETESSGGITEKNIAAYAKCGVNYISVGALTHHVKSLDLSLKFCK
jgi:nicotinate-nucleotide pyrophosphorylase (carboxylating)